MSLPFLTQFFLSLLIITSVSAAARGSQRPWLADGLELRAVKSRCEDLTDLNQHQTHLCNQRWDTELKLSDAAEMAHSECKEEFKFQRWNCSTENISHLYMMTRETSFVTAIGSAAIVHQIARDCADGAITACGCGVNHEYSTACDDNINYGTVFARQYLDTPLTYATAHGEDQRIMGRRDSLIRTAVTIHNNNAGRQIVEDTAQTKCKCYGLSGSCTTLICYKQVAQFHKIGKEILERYNDAVKVRTLFSPRRNTKLAYMDDSPDFCIQNASLGVQGTGGRPCLPHHSRSPGVNSYNASSHASCDTLCCGKGYNKHIDTSTRSCNCVFEWRTINLVCEKCLEKIPSYTCTK